tara:strand:- start:46 stop:444 length:399 start_codon:yes stop_codon:yes gene_type:complete
VFLVGLKNWVLEWVFIANLSFATILDSDLPEKVAPESRHIFAGVNMLIYSIPHFSSPIFVMTHQNNIFIGRKALGVEVEVVLSQIFDHKPFALRPMSKRTIISCPAGIPAMTAVSVRETPFEPWIAWVTKRG